ncbi:MAG: indolepyruvate ferredoxin oxidoreductase, alpha subunit [Bacteroidales bacterium]|jgi:indolepyruvate ferredoxin oxidoreductase alpha subunit|nr:indolepyruvate ferredoxin oxidoreductase, alpha subunit [Bacteroidales bacterium]MDN5328225.1 indolepyruvate ferredoxin oxidoreductase, alpha subunit [Bacteroidales bacterium]
MQKMILLGDEAIAQGAIDAGLSGIYAYPGTPSTEITEYIIASKEAKNNGIVANWTANEKTAVETALGMSYAGKRAMACMKHVGLNVAADPFINSAVTGINGGLIVVSADDPSMHSSQNEQDSRFYGKFALLPILEPSNQQEAYDMVHYGFDLSEKYQIPVLFRITTRLAHSRSGVERKAKRAQNEMTLPGDLKQFVLLPAIARRRYKGLLGLQTQLENESENSGWNQYTDGPDKSLGIIAAGLAYNYLLENFPEGNIPYPVLKIGQYPLPRLLVEKIAKECKTLLVLEEGMPVIEEMLKGYLGNCLSIKGRLDGTLPRDGELNPNLVAVALGGQMIRGEEVPSLVVPRPPSLCAGCPHTDSYLALNEAMKVYGKGRVFSDIGCYTLAAMPPLEAINSCVDMGASITMAKGAADAGLVPAVAVIGDSTFTHSGITGLLDAVISKSPITILILDNSTTGMTGGQPSAATGRIAEICKGIGVEEEHIRILKPLRKNHDENVKIIAEELAYPGVSVVIPTRECVQTLNRRMREKFKNKKSE